MGWAKGVGRSEERRLGGIIDSSDDFAMNTYGVSWQKPAFRQMMRSFSFSEFNFLKYHFND